jgi:peroxiredoxin
LQNLERPQATLVSTPLAASDARAQAPDLTLADAAGKPVQLASLWRDGPALLFFLRHFGCALCRAALFRIRERAAEFEARNSAVTVIAPTDAVAAGRFRDLYRVSFPVLADPLRHSYRAFGIHEGSLLDAIGPGVLARQLRESLHGNLAYVDPRGPTLRQLGGVVVVDRAGGVRFTHVAQPIYEYPSVDAYLQAIDEARADV